MTRLQNVPTARDAAAAGGDRISDIVAGHRQGVVELLSSRGHAQTNEIADVIGIKSPCTRQLLAQIVAEGLIETYGERRGRYYCLPESKTGPREAKRTLKFIA